MTVRGGSGLHIMIPIYTLEKKVAGGLVLGPIVRETVGMDTKLSKMDQIEKKF